MRRGAEWSRGTRFRSGVMQDLYLGASARLDREPLDVEVDVINCGHLAPLGRPDELARRLEPASA
jgi:hypothetical protein